MNPGGVQLCPSLWIIFTCVRDARGQILLAAGRELYTLLRLKPQKCAGEGLFCGVHGAVMVVRTKVSSKICKRPPLARKRQRVCMPARFQRCSAAAHGRSAWYPLCMFHSPVRVACGIRSVCSNSRTRKWAACQRWV